MFTYINSLGEADSVRVMSPLEEEVTHSCGQHMTQHSCKVFLFEILLVCTVSQLQEG
jgi:hypothetical protein